MKILLTGIRARMLALISVIFIVMLTPTAILAWRERQENLSVAMASVQSTAKVIANEQNRVVDYAGQVFDLLTEGYKPSVLLGSPQCHDLLSRFARKEPRLTSISVADLNGDLVCTSVAHNPTTSIADRDHFIRAQSTDDLVVGKAVTSRLEKKWSLPFIKAIRDDAGRRMGYLVVLVDLQWVNRELVQEASPDSARVGLIDNEGTVLARNPDPDHWIGRSAAKTPFFEALIAHKGVGSMESTGFDGVGRIYGLAPFAETTGGDIYLWVGLSKESVTGPVDRKFAWILLVYLVIFAVTFAAVWLGSERLVTRPVLALADAARRIGQGEHDVQTGVDYEDGELGKLARTIDEMAVSLMSHNEIIRLNRALNVLSRCNRTLVRASDEHQLLNDICQLLVGSANY